MAREIVHPAVVAAITAALHAYGGLEGTQYRLVDVRPAATAGPPPRSPWAQAGTLQAHLGRRQPWTVKRS